MDFPSEIRKTGDNKPYLKSFYFPDSETNDEDIYIVTQSGDTLTSIAQEYYNDVDLWRLIAVVNRLRKDSLYPPVGQQLRLINPTKVPDYLDDMIKLNQRII